MEPDYIETARLMARFQEQVSRSLDMTVDLAAMARDAGYARRILADVELRARDADLRATLRQLRERLPKLLPGIAGDASEGATTSRGRSRIIRFGGRSE
jgi:hypothetical protein